ncbi:cytochrome P450 [Sarocladium strictum]
MAILSQDGNMNIASAIGIGLVTILVGLHYSSGIKVHPKEPRVIRPWVPVIGHLLGMALSGGRYVKRLGLYHADPIFTLPVPGSRLYIVKDPALAATVQRTSKTLSFSPLIADIIARVLGLDAETIDVVRKNLDPEPGAPRGLLADVHDNVYTLLGPGAYLNELSVDAVRELGAQLHAYNTTNGDTSSQPKTHDLLLWIRHFVTFGTADYLFGPNNPLSHDPHLEEAFWAFDHGLGGLLMGVFPSVTASKAYNGREKMVAAFLKYYQNGHISEASKVIQDRHRIERSYNMSDDMVSRSALSFLFAGVVNTTTTTFWVVLRLFADPELLTLVRSEVDATFAKSKELHGDDHLSIGLIQDGCPTLVAVYRECLRLGSENFSVRLVKEDVMLNDQYYLKKGGVVQIAGGAMHLDKTIWGDDVAEFNHRRFLGISKSNGSNFHPAAFRSFGGGKTLCPGRHFATNEILCFAALIVKSYDLASPGGNKLEVPEKNDLVMPVHILEPRLSDCPTVKISSRPEAEQLGRLQVVT